MTQKGDPYTKVFSTLCEVIFMCYILAMLNILCSSVIKSYFTKMAIHPLFTVHVMTTSCVLQHIGIDRSRAIHISKRSVLYME